MTSARQYRIRTADGYVGRWTHDGPLVGTMPAGMAYAWTFDEAERLRDGFSGQVEAL